MLPVRSAIMRARILTCVVALGLALAGCSDDDGESAATLPPVTSTPSATAAGNVPPEAQEATPEGAAEFAGFFAVEVSEAYRALDPDRVRRLSSSDCQTCEQYISSIESIAAQDAEVGESYSVEVVDAAAPAADAELATADVTLTLMVGEFVVTSPSGEELAREPADDALVQDITLERAGDSWVVTEVTVS